MAVAPAFPFAAVVLAEAVAAVAEAVGAVTVDALAVADAGGGTDPCVAPHTV